MGVGGGGGSGLSAGAGGVRAHTKGRLATSRPARWRLEQLAAAVTPTARRSADRFPLEDGQAPAWGIAGTRGAGHRLACSVDGSTGEQTPGQHPTHQVGLVGLQPVGVLLQALQAAVAAAVVHSNANGGRQLDGDARLLQGRQGARRRADEQTRERCAGRLAAAASSRCAGAARLPCA